MVIAWMFCASTGIIIARHYKPLLPNLKPTGVQVWFFIHRPLMIAVTLISLSAFVIILW
jgi:hypothetical protein